jgi:hypothetical protein
MSRYKNNNYLDIGTVSGDGIVATTYEENYVYKGFGYQVHRRFQIPASPARYRILLDTSLVPSDYELFTRPLYMRTDEGQCFADTYGITSYTGGTELPILNRNSKPGMPAARSVFKYGVATVDPAVAPDTSRQYIIGAKGTQQNPGGGPSGDEGIKVFPPGGILMIDIANQENSAIWLEINFLYYEVPVVQ